LVSLPTKTVTLKQLDFNPEEKTIYDAYHKQVIVFISLTSLVYAKGGCDNRFFP
jgi:hypothetical protein